MDPESNLMEHAPQPASILLSIIGNRITGLLQPWGGVVPAVSQSIYFDNVLIELFTVCLCLGELSARMYVMCLQDKFKYFVRVVNKLFIGSI